MNWKIVLGVVIGILVAVGVFCLTVCIGSSIHGITFSEQIVEWFTKSS